MQVTVVCQRKSVCFFFRHLDFSFLAGWLCIIFDNDREASEIYLHLSGLLC